MYLNDSKESISIKSFLFQHWNVIKFNSITITNSKLNIFVNTQCIFQHFNKVKFLKI